MKTACFAAAHVRIVTASLVATAALSAPQSVQAQELSSVFAGVSVPKSATRVSEERLKSGLGRLMADGAGLFKLPPRAGGPGRAEVYFWKDAAYKPGRAPFMRTLLKSALTQVGYTYSEVDGFVDNTPNLFKEDVYNTDALDLTFTDNKPTYFHATNPTTKQTIMGMWLDQQSGKRLVLALGQAGFAGVASETRAPEITDPNVWLIKDLKDASKGMPLPAPPTFSRLTPKPRTVRGQVKDGSGKPIEGAHLIAHASAAGGFRTSFEGRTNAQGIYEIALPVGVCQIVNADCRVTYNGDTLTLPLHPADGERDQFDATAGHIENFVLRSRGAASADGGNYGGSLRINTHNAPLGSIVEVTLTPNGPLLDGSRGKTLVFRYPIKRAQPETFVHGIPVGRYNLTAKVYDGEDALPLQARKTFRDEPDEELNLTSVLPIQWKSASTSKAGLGRSGVQQFEIVLEP